jgi:hypothetical protein
MIPGRYGKIARTERWTNQIFHSSVAAEEGRIIYRVRAAGQVVARLAGLGLYILVFEISGSKHIGTIRERRTTLPVSEHDINKDERQQADIYIYIYTYIKMVLSNLWVWCVHSID